MTSPTKTLVKPEGFPIDGQRKLRRLVLGGSVGTSLLLVLGLAFAGPGGTAPAPAATATASPYADSVPGAETYPIPAEAADEAIPHTAADKEATIPPPAAQEATAPRKTDTDANKVGRNHVAGHAKTTSARPDNRASRGHPGVELVQ